LSLSPRNKNIFVLKINTIKLRPGLAILFALILLNSCSTKKNTFTRRFYHNMTAHYNAYFNGNESFKTGVTALEALNVDDYTQILGVYRMGTAEDATSLSSDFDVAYKKASIVISKHSIFIKKKEHVRWIPEAWLLIGKSHFYKGDYKLAAEAFEYIVKTYPEFPTYYTALVWLARTYTEQKVYDKAESTLALIQDKLDKNKKAVSKQALKEFPLVYANFQLKQENYDQAIEYLVAGIDKNRKKSVRARLSFILAQIYEDQGKVQKASALYDKVIKMNPSFEMSFNARINKAMCFDAANGNSDQIKKLLAKMAKDTKNKDYLDKIYYALAEVCMKEKDTTCALENYKLSADKSLTNTKQKAISYLKVARLYFSMPKYELSAEYYDSTMTVLPKDFTDYDKISSLAKILKDLVTNIKVVELQDSLQKLSKMTPTERNKIIDDLILAVIKAEQKAQEAENLKQTNLYSAQTTANTTATTAAWYFYNPTTVNFGKTEFVKKWGSRKLEDLWRLSNKTAVADFDATNPADSAGADSVKTNTKTNLKDRSYYLKAVPTTVADFKKSDSLIIAALYNIGIIYQNDLVDLPQAIKTYGELVKRFPDDKKYLIKTYYQLYLAYDVLKDETKQAYYKNLICTKSPESDYCNLIKDPNFKKISLGAKDLAAALYKETYNAYKKGSWDSVLIKSERALILYSTDTALAPKFIYLQALAHGKQKDSTKLVNSLQTIIDKYPTSSVKPKAQDLLDFWTGKVTKASTSATVTKDSTGATIVNYKFDADAMQLYVMIVNVSKTVKVSEVKNLLSNFNTKNFSTSSLTVSNIFLDNTRQMITINNFASKEKAMLYFNLLKKDATVFAKLKPADYTHFIISVDNYGSMYKNKDITNYNTFFIKNYLK